MARLACFDEALAPLPPPQDPPYVPPADTCAKVTW